MRRTARTIATTNHNTSNHKAALVTAANAIPAGDDGAERNGPPRTNHQMVTPGCTKSRNGFLATDGMTFPEASNARAAALAIASTAAAITHRHRVIRLMHDA